MSAIIDYNVRYGGRMVENNGCWEYVGGVRAVVDFQKDKVGYFLLRRLAYEDMHFTVIRGMWYCPSGVSFTYGLRFISSDRDVLGMEEARKAGLVTIYFDGEPLVENVSDNEEGQLDDNDGNLSIDEESIAPSGTHEVIFVDSSTTDASGNGSSSAGSVGTSYASSRRR
ncbi:hypothetical protein LINGRAHAP2_LOCUS7506 [Linum grandiflorum]